jgi:FkbM family methyltransferase
MIQNDLIFDLGLHRGLDANFYLRKGFRVIGVEPREDLCQIACQTNSMYVADGRLKVVTRALYDRSGVTVGFFINDHKDDWGSLYRGAAEQDGSTAKEVTVSTVTLADLFVEYGIPYYIKCDIEAADALFVEQLLHSGQRPTYVSVEATSADDIAKLRACGYNSFQIVNQQLNSSILLPYPAREGTYVEMQFTQETSGPFGRELRDEAWIDFRTTMKRLLDWYDLRDRDPGLAVGWLDIHARVA